MFSSIRSPFVPTKETVRLSYRASYRFLFLQIDDLATATLHATEGRWKTSSTRSLRPACFLDLSIDSIDDGASMIRSRYNVHNRTASVLSMPELATLQYVRRKRELMHPPFKKKKRVKIDEVYRFQGESIQYHRKNLVSGVVQTNLVDERAIVNQSRQVSSFLKILSEVYYGRLQEGNLEQLKEIVININGVLVPYRVSVKQAKIPTAVFGEKLPALCLRLKPRESSSSDHKKFKVWAASFKDVCERVNNKKLTSLANETLAWSMVPLVFDAHLSIGYVRCRLVDVTTSKWVPRKWPSVGKEGL